MEKEQICRYLGTMEEELEKILPDEGAYVDIQAYESLVRREESGKEIWTQALQEAIRKEKCVYLPKRQQPYYIDGSVLLFSDCHLKADPEAVIRQMEGVKVLMLRNEHTVDGTKAMPDTTLRDRNISVIGGHWEESYTSRAGYGSSGMYDEDRSFFGVSTCMLFNNVENLYVRDMVFAHTAGFALQAGEMRNAKFENISFVECFADGLHITGNTEDLVIRRISGQVNDDLVALNMYDWQNSSVNFGPMKRVLCEELSLSEDSVYKAMRIEPGTYYFEDGSSVDCRLEDAVIREVTGINTFKLYMQTPPYRLTEEPEKGTVGSGDQIYFEDITIDLKGPIDALDSYVKADPVKGTFAAFEIGSMVGNLYLENIKIRLYPEQNPMSYLLCIGPKSVCDGEWEIFDPYLSSELGNLICKDIYVNGRKVEDLAPYVKEITFRDVNQDGKSTGSGVIKKMTLLPD